MSWKSDHTRAAIYCLAILAVLAVSPKSARGGILDQQSICMESTLVRCLPRNVLNLVTDIPGDILSTAAYPFSRERYQRTVLDFALTFAIMPADPKLGPYIWDLSDWSGAAGMRPQTVQDWYIPGFLFYDSIMTYALPALHVSAAVANDPRLYRATYLGMKVWAYSIFVPIPFRYAVQRSYPYSKTGEINSPYEFHSPDAHDRNQSVLKEAGSFPSFRAAMWFGLADVFAAEYDYSYGWYGAASALTLLADHRHWPSDLFFGSLVGLSVGQSIRTRYGQSGSATFDILPFVAPHFIGVTLQKPLN